MSARALFHTAPRCVEIRELAAPRMAPGEVTVPARIPVTGVHPAAATLFPLAGTALQVSLDAGAGLTHVVLDYDGSGDS